MIYVCVIICVCFCLWVGMVFYLKYIYVEDTISIDLNKHDIDEEYKCALKIEQINEYDQQYIGSIEEELNKYISKSPYIRLDDITKYDAKHIKRYAEQISKMVYARGYILCGMVIVLDGKRYKFEKYNDGYITIKKSG